LIHQIIIVFIRAPKELTTAERTLSLQAAAKI